MSKEETTTSKVETSDSTKKTVKQNEVVKEPMMYIGPTIKGVVVKNTIYNSGLPKALVEEGDKLPVIKSLIVPVSKVAEARKNLRNTNSAIGICYDQVLSFSKKGGK